MHGGCESDSGYIESKLCASCKGVGHGLRFRFGVVLRVENGADGVAAI